MTDNSAPVAAASAAPIVRQSESLAALFEILVDDRESARWFPRRCLLAGSVKNCIALLRARWVIHLRYTELWSRIARGNRPPRRIVVIDLPQTTGQLILLEALLRAALASAITSVDERVIRQMRDDREALLRRLDGGNTLLIIAAGCRFYLRLFTVTPNHELRKAIFAATRQITMRSPNTLDFFDRAALPDATRTMLEAAVTQNIALAEEAWDMLHGNGPLKRRAA